MSFISDDRASASLLDFADLGHYEGSLDFSASFDCYRFDNYGSLGESSSEPLTTFDNCFSSSVTLPNDCFDLGSNPMGLTGDIFDLGSNPVGLTGDIFNLGSNLVGLPSDISENSFEDVLQSLFASSTSNIERPPPDTREPWPPAPANTISPAQSWLKTPSEPTSITPEQLILVANVAPAITPAVPTTDAPMFAPKASLHSSSSICANCNSKRTNSNAYDSYAQALNNSPKRRGVKAGGNDAGTAPQPPQLLDWRIQDAFNIGVRTPTGLKQGASFSVPDVSATPNTPLRSHRSAAGSNYSEPTEDGFISYEYVAAVDRMVRDAIPNLKCKEVQDGWMEVHKRLMQAMTSRVIGYRSLPSAEA